MSKFHYAIVGRIPEGENVTLTLQSHSVESAVKKFIDDLWATEPAATRKSTKKEHGVEAYIDAVLQSDSPILKYSEQSLVAAIEKEPMPSLPQPKQTTVAGRKR